MASRQDLYRTFFKKCGFEAVSETPSERQLRVMGRLLPNKWSFFAPVAHRLLTFSGQNGWTVDISKNYFLFEDRMRYAWRFIFQGEKVDDVLGDICATIVSAPQPARVEVSSMILPGYKPGQVRGGQNAKGKGASYGSEAVVGRAAVGRFNAGGG